MEAMGGVNDSPAEGSGWRTDPTGRFSYRYYDGRWTEHVVAEDGGQTTDTFTLEDESQSSSINADDNQTQSSDEDLSRSRRESGPLLSNGTRQDRMNTVESLIRIDKYRKPLREGSIGSVNFLGGSWNEFAEVALSAMMLETLLDLDARLEHLTAVIEDLEKRTA